MDLSYLAHVAATLIPHSLVGIALLQKAEAMSQGNEQIAAGYAEHYEGALAARIKRAFVVAIGPKHLQRQAFDQNFNAIKSSFANGLVRLYQTLDREAERIKKAKGKKGAKPKIPYEAASNFYAGLFGDMFESVLVLGASITVATEFASHVDSYADPRWVKMAIRTAEEDEDLDIKKPGAVDGVLKRLMAGDQRFIDSVVRFIESGKDDEYEPGAPINIDPSAHIDNIPDYDINGKHKGKAQPEVAPEVEPVTMPAAKPATKATEEPAVAKPAPAPSAEQKQTPEKKRRKMTEKQARGKLWNAFISDSSPKNTLDGFEKRLETYKNAYADLGKYFTQEEQEKIRKGIIDVASLFHSYTFNEHSGHTAEIRLTNLKSGLSSAEAVGLDIANYSEHIKRYNGVSDDLLAATLTSGQSVVHRINAFTDRYAFMEDLGYNMPVVGEGPKVRKAAKSFLIDYAVSLNADTHLSPEGRMEAFKAMFASFFDKDIVEQSQFIGLSKRVR